MDSVPHASMTRKLFSSNQISAQKSRKVLRILISFFPFSMDLQTMSNEALWMSDAMLDSLSLQLRDAESRRAEAERAHQVSSQLSVIVIAKTRHHHSHDQNIFDLCFFFNGMWVSVIDNNLESKAKFISVNEKKLPRELFSSDSLATLTKWISFIKSFAVPFAHKSGDIFILRRPDTF